MSENNGIYPELSVELDPNSVTSVGSSTGGSINAIVSGALRQVLGWRPNANDPKGFVDSLNQSFQQDPENDSKQWMWKPHSYTVHTDGSAITGAQASIYDRAQNARDKALPLLDALMPLRTDSDDEDVDATRAIIESDLTELVNEIGKVGGPRVQRVDIYFESLLGTEFIARDSLDIMDIGGNIGRLRERLGLNQKGVNTIEEEENLTNYFILADYIVSLYQSWRSQEKFFDREGPDVFLGTQLVWINRALANLGESVHEARFIFDSVFINDAERETLHLFLNGSGPSMTLAELFDWVENFSTVEAPRLIRDGGKDGVIALRPQVSKLVGLLNETSNLAAGDGDNPAPGFHTPRAQRSLQELVVIATDLNTRVTDIERATGPQIDTVDLDFQATQGVTIFQERSVIQIEGAGFDEGAEVYIFDETSGFRIPCLVAQVHPKQILCISPIELRAATIPNESNTYLLVFNPDGGEDRYRITDDDFPQPARSAAPTKAPKK